MNGAYVDGLIFRVKQKISVLIFYPTILDPSILASLRKGNMNVTYMRYEMDIKGTLLSHIHSRATHLSDNLIYGIWDRHKSTLLYHIRYVGTMSNIWYLINIETWKGNNAKNKNWKIRQVILGTPHKTKVPLWMMKDPSHLHAHPTHSNSWISYNFDISNKYVSLNLDKTEKYIPSNS